MKVKHEPGLDIFCQKIKNKITSNPTIFEIGARDCSETLGFLQYFPNSSIVSFECNPDTLPVCRKRVSGIGNITLVESAVSDSQGKLVFRKIDTNLTETIHKDGNPGASSFFKANPDYLVESYKQEEVVVNSITLESYIDLNSIEKIDILWMDIQGSELNALMGTGKYLDRVSYIHTEVEFFPIYINQPLYKDIKKFLLSKGFCVYGITSVGAYAGDVIFIRKDLVHFFYIRSFFVDLKFRLVHILKKIFTKKIIISIIRKNHSLFSFPVALFFLLRNFVLLFSQNSEYKSYKEQITEVIKQKKIVLNIKYGGLGDWMSFTSLPRLLKSKYNVDFYLDEKSLDKIRNKDIFKLAFEMNPYFKGVAENKKSFSFKIYAKEKSLLHFITDRFSKSITEVVEEQFLVSEKGIPELFYTPNLIEEYNNVVLIDKNFISGKSMGWLYSEESFDREIKKHTTEGVKIVYIDPKKQNLFKYVDMIYSCKHFITVLSGGATIAAAFSKHFTVILPYNVYGESVDQFVFKSSEGMYVR